MNHTHGAYVGKANDNWQGRVHKLMLKGLGYDDIAVTLGCPAAAVRAEAAILAQEGRLDWFYSGRRG